MQLANMNMTNPPTMGSLTSIKVEHTINFIEAVKSHQAIYDTTHQDYKNIEEKTKAWRSIAHEMGITVEAAKRKWKNLRDSYTKYLRSFRVGTKTSRKYQYWAHAEHMDFLRPFQGPGRSSNPIMKPDNGNCTFINVNEDDTGCDLGFEMVDKCFPQEPVHEEIVAKTIAYSTNGPTLASTYDRKTATALKDVDSTTMFFLSLAKSVRELPPKKQTTVKMQCMKVVYDAEMEVDNSISEGDSISSSVKIYEDLSPVQNNTSADQDMNKKQILTRSQENETQNNETNPEHFLYVMSPSRVETMIDISSDEEAPKP